MFGLFRMLRRRRLMQAPMAPTRRQFMQRAPLVRRLPAELQRRLAGLVQVFLHEKNFEGCNGLEVSEEMRVVIAANACVLLLGRRSDFFPHMGAVLLYPASWRVRQVMTDEMGLEEQVDEENLGEAWERGNVILSWQDILLDCDHPDDGFNLVLHEFSHQLDMEDGTANGTPLLPPALARDWKRVMSREFEALRWVAQALDEEGDGPDEWAWEPRPACAAHEGVLDPYGAEDPAEFFAVATEAFFEDSARLRERHGELYGLLAEFYGLNPAAWP